MCGPPLSETAPGWERSEHGTPTFARCDRQLEKTEKCTIASRKNASEILQVKIKKSPRQARDQSHQRDRVRWRHDTPLGVHVEPVQVCDPLGAQQPTFLAAHTEPMGRHILSSPNRITLHFSDSTKTAFPSPNMLLVGTRVAATSRSLAARRA
jgi:hypothetical protein